MVRDVGGLGKSFFVRQYERAAAAEETSGFKETLRELSKKFEGVQRAADDSVESVVMGTTIDSHDVMIAAREAGLAFDLILEVRNKLMDAYHEIMRMQI